MSLNNREIALLIIFLFAITLSLFNKGIRKATFNLLDVAFSSKLLFVLEFNIIYSLVMVIFLALIGFWNLTLLKGTILWFIFTSLSLIYRVNKESEKDDFLRKIITSNFQILVFLEFINNLFVFDLYIELLLQPVLFFLVIIIAFSETDAKYNQVKNIFNWILSLLGILLFAFTIFNLYNNWEYVFNISTLKDFTLPIILTIIYIPFIYTLALYAKYEIYFVRMNHINRGNPLNRYAKYRLLLFCNVRLKRLIHFTRTFPVLEYNSKSDIKNILKNYGITRRLRPTAETV